MKVELIFILISIIYENEHSFQYLIAPFHLYKISLSLSYRKFNLRFFATTIATEQLKFHQNRSGFEKMFNLDESAMLNSNTGAAAALDSIVRVCRRQARKSIDRI